MTDLQTKIGKSLIKTIGGLTSREIAEEHNIKVLQVSGTIGYMINAGFVEKGEKCEIEGQIYLITEKGIAEFGGKSEPVEKIAVEKIAVPKPKNKPVEVKNNVPESALEQNEKTPVETIEAAPIVAESVLEQNVIDEIVEKVNAEVAVAEVAEFEDLPLKKMNPDEFQIWKIVDQAGTDFIEILNNKKAKPIDNIEYKIQTLESLADIYNTKISATLREIAIDLRG